AVAAAAPRRWSSVRSREGRRQRHRFRRPWPLRRAAGRLARAELVPGLRLPRRRLAGRWHGPVGPARDACPAMVAPLRAGEVVVDVADRLEVARAAVRAPLDRAVGREDAVHGAREILEQELLADAGVEVIPRKRLAERPPAKGEREVETVRGERLAPDVHATVLRPPVEARAETLGGLEHVRETAVAAREDALERRQLGVVPAELDTSAAE